MNKESLINQKFQEWRRKGLLNQKGELLVEEEWKFRDLLMVFFFIILPILLFPLMMKNETFICLIPFLLLFLLFPWLNNWKITRPRIAPSISISPQGIIKRVFIYRKTVKFDEIIEIQTNNFDPNTFTIGSKDDSIKLPFSTSIVKEPFTLHEEKHEILLFFKEIFHDKIGIPENPKRHPDVAKLFAAVASISNDESSMAYAIDYLNNDPEIIHKSTFVPEHFALYCETETKADIDTLLRVTKSKTYSERKELLDHLFECAFMSDGVDVNELNLLQKIAKYFVIKEWDFKAMQYKYEYSKAEKEKEERKKEERRKKANASFKNVTTEAHRTLGLKADATIEEIKSAYHELAMRVHPDKLPADATPQQIEEANENFRVINEAYKFLLELEPGKSLK